MELSNGELDDSTYIGKGIKLEYATLTDHIIQGQLFTARIIITNNNPTDIYFLGNWISLNLTDIDNNVSGKGYLFTRSFCLKAGEKYEIDFIPLYFIYYHRPKNQKETFPYYWYAHRYQHSITIKFDGKEIQSNSLQLLVEPVPDKWQEPFNELTRENNKINDDDVIETGEKLIEKYRGSIFEKEFYSSLFNFYKYKEELRSKDRMKQKLTNAKKYAEEFLKKYYNSAISIEIYDNLNMAPEENSQIIKRVYDYLKSETSENSKPNLLLEHIEKNRSHYDWSNMY